MTEQLSREEIRRRVRARAGKPAEVPGLSDNPATNLLVADVVFRIGTRLLRTGVEKTFLKKRYGKDTASAIVDNRSIWRTLGAVAVSKFATRSLPGAALVGTGIVGKLLYDASKTRRENIRKGDQVLLEQAAEETDSSGT